MPSVVRESAVRVGGCVMQGGRGVAERLVLLLACYNKNGDRASCARTDSRVVGRGRHVEGVLSE